MHHEDVTDDFGALVTSLGEHAVDYIGKDNLRQLALFADEHNGTAQIEIVLERNDWATQSYAIDKMLELRAMFLDEISISYRFLEEDDQTTLSASERSTFAYA